MSDEPPSEDLLRLYRRHLRIEPPRDAGNAPMLPAHEEMADAHRLWQQQERAFRTLLAPRLLAEALERLTAVDNNPEAHHG